MYNILSISLSMRNTNENTEKCAHKAYFIATGKCIHSLSSLASHLTASEGHYVSSRRVIDQFVGATVYAPFSSG